MKIKHKKHKITIEIPPPDDCVIVPHDDAIELLNAIKNARKFFNLYYEVERALARGRDPGIIGGFDQFTIKHNYEHAAFELLDWLFSDDEINFFFDGKHVDFDEGDGS